MHDCTVHGYKVDGIGELPRAYVVLKSGYEATAEDLLAYVDTRAISETEKLRGGIVFVEKLAKDPSGKLYISLDHFNKDAEGMDYEFIRQQPKVSVSKLEVSFSSINVKFDICAMFIRNCIILNCPP